MSGYERAQKSLLLQRLEEVPQRLIIITGPRQSGKTTLVQQTLAQIDRPTKYLAADEPDSLGLPTTPALGTVSSETSLRLGQSRDARWLIEEWERARMELTTADAGFILVVDEIQKIPNWSETVKGLWDADRREGRNMHVILLGSAPLLMLEGMSESLAGRFETIRLTHWSFPEMSAAFDFDLAKFIYFGGYPGGASLVHDQARWRAYIQDALVKTNIERDILAMRRVDKPALLKQLFELSAEYSGQILSYNKLLGQLQDAGNTTTLARYLDLLSDAGLVAGVSKYSGGGYRRRASIPKLNVLNTALMSAQSTRSFEEAQADRRFWGRMVESAIGAHLFNNLPRGFGLHYWREDHDEVDFVLERDGRLVAIEVKSGEGRSTARALGNFAQRFKVQRLLVVGADGIPIPEFLSMPVESWFEDP